nr:uncharacterized protein LOC128692743 [Cherax quadricarinatus]XP_053638049.1 uncharacterized protein LOC128692743 [Cherax quadricarinatus]XP_053638050.1 uncharacterized protein LOC128692743 [Cherax quadricarinatus]XP_053638051.1 uncharacterized protein LOC128692743 [Cherax quadricarinatus]
MSSTSQGKWPVKKRKYFSSLGQDQVSLDPSLQPTVSAAPPPQNHVHPASDQMPNPSATLSASLHQDLPSSASLHQSQGTCLSPKLLQLSPRSLPEGRKSVLVSESGRVTSSSLNEGHLATRPLYEDSVSSISLYKDRILNRLPHQDRILTRSPHPEQVAPMSPYLDRASSQSPYPSPKSSSSPHQDRLLNRSPHQDRLLNRSHHDQLLNRSPHHDRMTDMSPHMDRMLSLSPYPRRTSSRSPHQDRMSSRSPYEDQMHSPLQCQDQHSPDSSIPSPRSYENTSPRSSGSFSPASYETPSPMSYITLTPVTYHSAHPTSHQSPVRSYRPQVIPSSWEGKIDPQENHSHYPSQAHSEGHVHWSIHPPHVQQDPYIPGLKQESFSHTHQDGCNIIHYDQYSVSPKTAYSHTHQNASIDTYQKSYSHVRPCNNVHEHQYNTTPKDAHSHTNQKSYGHPDREFYSQSYTDIYNSRTNSPEEGALVIDLEEEAMDLRLAAKIDAQEPMDEDSQGTHDSLKKISTKRKRNRGPKSWEFLMRLLADEATNPSVIRWEDEAAATFRLVQPQEIARMWGTRSSKPNLSYNNFARALRYHYSTKFLTKVSERQLVYGCGNEALKFLAKLKNQSC